MTDFATYRFETIIGPVVIRMQQGMSSNQTRSASLIIDLLPDSSEARIGDRALQVGKERKLSSNGGKTHYLAVKHGDGDDVEMILELYLQVQTTAGKMPGISIHGEPAINSPEGMDLVVTGDRNITVEGQPDGDNIHAVYEDGTTYIMPTSNPVHLVPEDKSDIPFRVMAGPFGKHTAMTNRHVMINRAIFRMNLRGDVIEKVEAAEAATA